MIVAHGLTASMSDHGQLVPLVDGIEAGLGRRPEEVSADSGYMSEANLETLQERAITAYVATGRAKHPDKPRHKGRPLTQAMQRKLKRAGRRSRYRLRKQVVEPVFGQINRLRRRRNDTEYPSPTTPGVTTDEATQALGIAREVIDGAKKLLEAGRLDEFG